MAYVINKFDGTQLFVLEDGTINTSLSIGLVGRNYTGYGETQNENFLWLLENFANTEPPPRPIIGQSWFDTSSNALTVYNGTAWTPVGSAIFSETEPAGFDGSLWFKTTTNQLFVYNSSAWILVGPQAVDNFGLTEVRSRSILSTFGSRKPIVELLVNDKVLAMCSEVDFTIADAEKVDGFLDIKSGINLSSDVTLQGNVIGNASTSSTLETSRKINGVPFNGSSDITVSSNTTGSLVSGTYITGNNFNGSVDTVWDIDATSANVIGKIVSRDASGNFEAGTITANLIGDVSGNVTVSTGTSTFNRVVATEFVGATLSGNAFTATKLQTPRTINGVQFDGTSNIDIPIAAENLSGTRIAATVKDSYLTSLGTLISLSTADAGIVIGSNQLKINNTVRPTIQAVNRLDMSLTGDSGVALTSSSTSLSLGGENKPSLIPQINASANLGISTYKWNNVYANLFVGTATSAQYADLAENYVADAEYEPGTVLEFGGSEEVTIASDATRRVAGVVSTNPAYLMNSDCSGNNVVSIALQGRVPCKVRGSIKKGDMLVSGGNGFARPEFNPLLGSVIGKALEDFNGTSGIIEVAVGRI